jgi:hypothetical protein
MATYTGDQGGNDLILADGDYIHGIITNCRKFKIPSGVTVYVTPWNGSSYGSVEVYANDIIHEGTIDGSGAGYGGGGAGGGGCGGNGGYYTNYCYGGSGGGGTAGGSTGGAGVNCINPPTDDGCRYASGKRGGAGGQGGGTYGGSGGAYGIGDNRSTCNSIDSSVGSNGSAGGYRAAASNGDSSTDEVVYMGAGGGGAGGGGGGSSRCC